MATGLASTSGSNTQDQPGGASSKEVEVLSNRIHALLLDQPPEGVRLSAVWNLYKKKYKELPSYKNLAHLNVKKRSDLLLLCPYAQIQNDHVKLVKQENIGKNEKEKGQGDVKVKKLPNVSNSVTRQPISKLVEEETQENKKSTKGSTKAGTLKSEGEARSETGIETKNKSINVDKGSLKPETVASKQDTQKGKKSAKAKGKSSKKDEAKTTGGALKSKTIIETKDQTVNVCQSNSKPEPETSFAESGARPKTVKVKFLGQEKLRSEQTKSLLKDTTVKPNTNHNFQPSDSFLDEEFPSLAMANQYPRRSGWDQPPPGTYGYSPQFGVQPQPMMNMPPHQPMPYYVQPSPQNPNRTRRNISKEELQNVLQDCIDRLSEAKEWVTVDKIEKLVLEHFKINQLGDLGLWKLQNYNLINEHVRLQCKVNAYIHAFIMVNSVCTLYEIHKNLSEFVCGGNDFETTKLGPLQKNPVIYDYFKFPEDADIPIITTTDIAEKLKEYMTVKNLWTANLSIPEFLTYITERYGMSSPYELGVRIRSMNLLRQVLKRAQKDTGQAVRNVSVQMNSTVMNDISTAFNHLRISVVDGHSNMCTVRKEFLTMPVYQVISQVFSKARVLLDSLKYINEQNQTYTKLMEKEYNKNVEAIDKFHKLLMKENLLGMLFQFAICIAREDMHQQLNELLEATQFKITQTQGGAAAEQAPKQPPPVGQLVELAERYLDRCLVHGALNLDKLWRIENKMLEDFNTREFSSLGQGTFLGFMQNNDIMKKRLEESGGTQIGAGGGGTSGSSVYHPTQQDILHFISQAVQAHDIQIEQLEKALCFHYNVKDVKCLGQGTMSHLQSVLERSHHNKEHTVLYQPALCVKSSSSWTGNKQVGIMGHQTKERALACLQSCPLLEDLAEWSHWQLVFQPEHGDLKDFIHKYGGVRTINVTGDEGPATMTTNILALEVQPGVLLKTTCDTSADLFLSAAQGGDVSSTCGHLASLIVAHKGIEGTPLALLGNHIKTALFTMQMAAPSDVPGAPQSQNTQKAGLKFVLDCLIKMPLMLCQATATQVFLEPLSHVVGAAKSKEQLYLLCENSQQQSRLQLLGCLLGVQDWAASFEQRCRPPQECLESMLDDKMQGELAEDLIEVESDSEENLADDAEEVFTLSDDSDDEETTMATDTAKLQVKTEVADEVIIDSSFTDDDKSDLEVVEVTQGQNKDIKLIEGLTDDEQICWKIVENIRREEFGMEVVLNEDGQKLMLKQQERLGRSLVRLSRDLYSKDTHFVLELIQNADDNDYPPQMLMSGVKDCPAVKFTVEQDRISVMNNECGFLEGNIRAICDVGKSTKGKHKYGYIGQKGIGFKSVFRITDCPEIHSNGYHIKFDVNSGPMGYILPHWVTDAPQDQENWKTKIILPMKEEFQSTLSTQSMSARFQDIHPSLLLFLHRLKSITIHNKVDDYIMEMRRTDLDRQMVEIQHSAGLDRWLVVRKMLDASNISLQAKSGVEVESTEIAMAFPINKEIKDKHSCASLAKQPVFAFLPLRSYGFRFVIQGDFDVPSSREDVDKDSLWNQWLRTELHTLFVDVMQVFKCHPEFSGIEGLAYFMGFIPHEDEILDFFRPVASNILQQLRSRPCFPTQPGPSGVMEWKLPSQLVVCKDRLMREVMTSEDLQQHLGLSYLHDDIATTLNPSLVQALGIQKLKSHHLLEVAKGVARDLQQQDMIDIEASIRTVAKLLACVYRSLDEFHADDNLRQGIMNLPMMPLSTGDFVSLASMAVFFPLALEERHDKRNTVSLTLQALEKDLKTLHPFLFSCLDEVANVQVAKLLEGLGVKRFTPADILHHHIIPTFKTDAWKTKPEDLLISYLIYTKEIVQQMASLISHEELRPLVVLKTNKGLLRPADTPIHFSTLFGHAVLDLPSMFPGYEWTLVDSCYLQNTQSEANRRSWFEFFSKLGLVNGLAVTSRIVTIMPDQWHESTWSAYKDLLPDSQVMYLVKDHVCEEFVGIVRHIQADHVPLRRHKMACCLFKILDEGWDSYKCYTEAELQDQDCHKVREVASTFGTNLRELPWVPATVSNVYDSRKGHCDVIEEVSQKCGRELFLPARELRELLAHHVSYFATSAITPSLLLKFLEVRQSVNAEFIKGLLQDWAKHRDEKTAEGEQVYFLSSVSHMKTVYRYLHENLPPKQLQDLLHETPFVFLPGPQMDFGTMQGVVVPGRLFRRTEVRWQDPTGLFHKYSDSFQNLDITCFSKISIHHIYKELQDFFLRGGRVEEQPEVEDYVELLRHLASNYTTSQVLGDVQTAFAVLGNALQQAVADPDQNVTVVRINNAKAKLKNEAVIPVRGNRWVKLADNPMIANDRYLERLFNGRSEHGVYFVDLSNRSQQNQQFSRFKKVNTTRDWASQESAIVEFLEALGVQRLTDCIKTHYNSELFYPCPELQGYVRQVLPYIQRDLITEYPHVYAKLTEKKISNHLPNVVFGQVGKLEVVYTLKHLENMVATTPANCRFTDQFEFFILKTHVNNYSEINGELARYFSCGDDNARRELRDLLIDILPFVQNNNSGELERFLRRNDITALPDGETPWTVPEPVYYQPDPEPEEEMEFDAEEGTADDLLVKFHSRQTRDGDKPAVASWPPRSGHLDPEVAATIPKTEHRPGVWPPPAPPKSTRAKTDISAKLRPARADLVQMREEAERKDKVEDSEGKGERKDEDSGGKSAREKGDSKSHRDDSDVRSVGSHSGSHTSRQYSSSGSHRHSDHDRDRPMSHSDHDHRSGDSHRDTKESDSKRCADNEHSPKEHKERRPSTDGQKGEKSKATPEAERSINRSHESPHRSRDTPNTENQRKRPRMESLNDAEESRIQSNIGQGNIWFDPPVWKGEADIPFEELGTGEGLPVSALSQTELPANSDMVKVGRWGEEIVYQYLLTKMGNGDTSMVKVRWLNEEKESGAPYDLEIHYYNEETQTTNTVYVEVKATIKDQKAGFEISVNEIQFALDHQENYHLYRVYNAGDTQNVRLTKLENLITLMDSHIVKLFMVV